MDLYRFDPLLDHDVDLWIAKFGAGPFCILREHKFRDEMTYVVLSLQDKRIHVGWGPVEAWGVLDPFLTAASEAIEKSVEQQDEP